MQHVTLRLVLAGHKLLLVSLQTLLTAVTCSVQVKTAHHDADQELMGLGEDVLDEAGVMLLVSKWMVRPPLSCA